MSRHVAFLRAVNVGGHTVTMDRLRDLFTGLGLEEVETFIASGNVIFEGGGRDLGGLEARIAHALRIELGYDVATFVRTLSELTEVVAYPAFTADELATAAALNVAFSGAPLGLDDEHRLRKFESGNDHFAVRGREVYWLCRMKQSQSTFSNAVLEKTLGRPSTLRSFATVARIVTKYG